MKKFFLFSFITLLFACAFTDDAYAQRRGKKKKKKSSKTDEYFDESGFANRLWYGGSVPFQIGGDGLGNNALLIGLSPMVGYKINDFFSVGPRASIKYYEIYWPGDNFKMLQLGIGAFGRARIASSFFAQIEYETLQSNEISDLGTGVDISDDNLYLGIGYHSPMGNAWGYEIMILFNFQEEREDVVPIEYRAGLTYKF